MEIFLRSYSQYTKLNIDSRELHSRKSNTELNYMWLFLVSPPNSKGTIWNKTLCDFWYQKNHMDFF